MSYLDEVMALTNRAPAKFEHAHWFGIAQELASEISARADARIAELERECSQWRDELRIYRETENARIAELEQSVTVRDTEIARLRNKINSMLEILSDELPKATRRRVGARFNAELDNKP